MCTLNQMGDSLSCSVFEENINFNSENSSTFVKKFSIMPDCIYEFSNYICCLFWTFSDEIFKLLFQSENYEDIGDLYAGLIFTIIWIALFSLNNSNWFNEQRENLASMRGTSISNVFDQFIDFLTGIVCWFWDTLELLVDIFLEFLTRTLELIIVLMNLIFQGIVNVIGSITCDDVEDFASACIVVLLWIGAVKIILSIFNQKSGLNMYNPFGKSDPMYAPGNVKFENSCAPRRGARRRGMPRRRGRRRYNSPC